MAGHGLLTQKEIDALMKAFESHGLPVKEPKSTRDRIAPAEAETAAAEVGAQLLAKKWMQALAVLMHRPVRVRMRSMRRNLSSGADQNRFCFAVLAASGKRMHLLCTEPFVNLINEASLGHRPFEPPTNHTVTPIDIRLFETTGNVIAAAFSDTFGVPEDKVELKADPFCEELQGRTAWHFDVEISSVLRTSLVVITEEAVETGKKG